MVALISCTCGHKADRNVSSSAEAQIIADVHMAQFPKRAYRHNATYTLSRGETVQREVAAIRKGVNRILGRF